MEEEDKLDHNKVSFRFNKLVLRVRERVQQYLILVIHVVVPAELKKQKSLMVKIPKGVDDGSRIRLSGEGEAGTNGGQQGDLYIFVNVNEHSIFAREDENLFAEVPISMIDAAVGGSIDVPIIDGR